MKRVRSTLLSSAIVTLRERGHYDAYLAKLPAHRHDDIQSLVAGVWIAMPIAMDHYEACEAIGLSADEMVAVGAAVGHRIQASTLSTLTRLAAGAGATPWAGFGIYDRLWKRMFDGGGFTIDKVGPKDALITMAHLSFARYAYFRASFRGVHLAGIEIFGKKGYVREMPTRSPETNLAFRASWA